MSPIAQLTGTSGNIFSVIGLTNRYLKKAIRNGDFTRKDLDKFNDCVQSSGSYDEALRECMNVLEAAGYEVA